MRTRHWHSSLVQVSSVPASLVVAIGSGLLGGGLAALATGGLVLGGRAALVRLAAAAVGLLAAVLRGVGRVGDPGGPLLGHALVLEGLVLLLVLDVAGLRGHRGSPLRWARAT